MLTDLMQTKNNVPAGKIETKQEIFLPTGMRGGAPRGGPPRGAGGNRGGINRPSNQWPGTSQLWPSPWQPTNLCQGHELMGPVFTLSGFWKPYLPCSTLCFLFCVTTSWNACFSCRSLASNGIVLKDELTLRLSKIIYRNLRCKEKKIKIFMSAKPFCGEG